MSVEFEEHEAILRFMYQVPMGIVQVSPDGDFGMMNPSAVQLTLQIAPGCLNLFTMLEKYAPEVRLLAADFHAERGTVLENYRVDFGRRSETAANPLVIAFSLVKLAADNLMVVMQDVSRSAAAEAAAKRAEQRLRIISDKVRDYAVFDLDHEGSVSSWSHSGRRLFAFEAHEVVGKPFDALMRDAIDFDLSATLARAQRLGWASLDAWFHRSQNTSFRGSAVLSVLEGVQGSVGGFTLVVQDQSEALALDDKNESRQDVDPQTGALVRSAYERGQHAMFEKWRQRGVPLSVALVDVDRLQWVQEEHGDEAADDVLRFVVGTIRDQTLPQHILIRWSLDRFLLLLPEVDLVGARRILERVRVVQEQEIIDIQTTLTKATISAGLAHVGPTDEDFHGAVARADSALMQAKSRGRNQLVLAHLPEAAVHQ